MKKLNKDKNNIEFYDSIEELPHRRYMKFNKEMMRSMDVGSSVSDIVKRVDKALAFLNIEDPQKAIRELSNLRLTIAYVMNEVAPKGLALAAMVKSVNNLPREDISTSGLQATLEILQEAGIVKSDVDELTAYIKKK